MEYRKQKKMCRWGFLFHRIQMTTENGSLLHDLRSTYQTSVWVCVILMYWRQPGAMFCRMEKNLW
jgi:hypothetical protein